MIQKHVITPRYRHEWTGNGPCDTAPGLWVQRGTIRKYYRFRSQLSDEYRVYQHMTQRELALVWATKRPSVVF